MASVHFDQVRHRQPGSFDALVDLDLLVDDGELVVFLGGPGSGASTALRLVAGFEDADDGTIRIAGRDVTGVAPRDRGVAMVLPHHALYPHLTARDHLRFPLVVSGVADDRCADRVADVAARLRLTALLDRRPDELSPAERQRVALARAVVRGPEVLLVDEPFAELDPITSREVCADLRRICDDLGTTTIAVMADRTEGLSLSSRVVHVDRGRCLDARPSRIPA